jgi:hypothetical protein
VSRVRHRRSTRGHLDDGDETVGLAGWMYTDMLLGLVVVFLGSISVVVPARVLGSNSDGEIATVLTTTTTTTTIPIPTTTVDEVALCPRLYSSSDAVEPEDGIYILLPKDLEGSELGAEFDKQLEEELNEELGFQEFLGNNPSPQIGLAIASGSYGGAEPAGAGQARARKLLDNLVAERSEIFESSIRREGGRRAIDRGFVGIEIFPIIQAPCS